MLTCAVRVHLSDSSFSIKYPRNLSLENIWDGRNKSLAEVFVNQYFTAGIGSKTVLKKIFTTAIFPVVLLIINSFVLIIVEFVDSNLRFLLVPLICLNLLLGFFILFYKLKNSRQSEEMIRSEIARAESAEKYICELQEYVAQQDEANRFLKESKEKFRHAAFHDALTNLPNRNLFIETLRFTLEKHKQTPNYNFAVLFLNLNRFKTINDSLGHATGDSLIQNVAKRLTQSVREGDLVARLSGDNFAIILSNIRQPEAASDIAKIIKKSISAPFSIEGKEVFSSISIGIAPANKSYKKAEEMLRDADIAMYHAKEEGKGIEIFTSAMHAHALKLLQLETDLRHAIERKELCAYFQPIVEISTLKLVGFESLIRWNHPEKGLISPSEFIPISENTNLIIPITLWMLRHCCEQMVSWHSQSPLNKDLFLSVNLSGKHFTQSDLVSQVRKIVVETGIKPYCLKLEITESAVMENAETVISMLKELKEIGVQLSIDDFGTGYSSLSYLHRFPIDTLKIDRSFVSTMEDGSENGEIVRTVIALAKTLGMNVVAEGIETVHQLHQLQILKCEYGQGYLFSPPVTIEDAQLFVQDKKRWQKMLSGAIPEEITPRQDTLEIVGTQ